MTIHWPLLLKVDSDKQLMLLDSQEEWLTERDHLAPESLTLIDSQGVCYHCQDGALHPSEEQILLPEIIQWVSDYACQNGHFCSAKIGADSLAQLFDMVRYLEDS
ncbi:DUF4144 domain-containing protein [Shewanella rhizosphaerae]|uniref:DUF4144 domain-containing protein n=1 Tax=Shewanella rhizosphaerae TaxID=2864207 RepID=UPI001C65B858|nr:DUF4144 domain-containing protein [Shewanella rhizosphaerae]QYK12278.1 DUF4144 domain-containing protein [Shewanella rhizosphaerae]